VAALASTTPCTIPVRSPSELGSERSEPLRRSARRHVLLLITVLVSFLSFLFISRPLSPPRVRQQAPFKTATQDENDLRVPIAVLPAPFLLYFLFLLPLTSYSNNAYRHNAATTWQATVRSLFCIIQPFLYLLTPLVIPSSPATPSSPLLYKN
jgi:hypothetical protein